MKTITIRRRVRPLRLAFLMRPNDRAALLRVIEANTCLWGGRYNAIIPYARSGLRDAMRSWSCDEVVAGYLAHFEPDFLVDLVGEGRRFFERERVLLEGAVFDRARNGYAGHGLSVSGIYRHHYRREFRFVRRHPDAFVLPACTDKRVDLVLAAAFGRFPASLAHFAKNFRDVFEPDEGAVDASTFYTKLRAGTPIKMTGAELHRRRRGLDGPAVFLLDSKRPQDVIDYWNLRALGWQLLPFPVQWEDSLMERARSFLHDEINWYATNSQLRPPTMLLAARSFPADEFQRLAEHLRKDAPAALRCQPWHPQLWNRWADSDDVERCTLEAAADEVERPVQGGGEHEFVTLPALAPSAYDGSVSIFDGGPKWATVIAASSDSPVPTVASVVPVEVDDIASVLMLPRREVAVLSEGITLYCDDRFRQFLQTPGPEAVARGAFKSKGFTSKTSAAGHIALAIIDALGGLRGTGSIAFPELLKRLDEMSHGLVELDAENRANGKPQARARSDTRARIFGLLKKLRNNNAEWAERLLGHLLGAGVFRVGLQLSCPECSQATWFPLDAVRDSLRCERCMATFPFPAASPPRDDAWTYRTQGPFSVENFAQGSYAVVLALRLLMTSLQHADHTWISSTTLTNDAGKELESDFVVWRRDPFSSTVTLMFGECKSFGTFGTKDFENADGLAQAFPGAFHLFVTFREQVTAGERRRLRAFARAGRKPIEGGRWRAPVVVLTGREIFSDFGPPFCWKDLGEPFVRAATFCKPATDLLSLAQATQYAYLGLEPEESRILAMNLDIEPAAPRPTRARRRARVS